MQNAVGSAPGVCSEMQTPVLSLVRMFTLQRSEGNCRLLHFCKADKATGKCELLLSRSILSFLQV